MIDDTTTALAHRSAFPVPDAAAMLDTVRWVSNQWLKGKYGAGAIPAGTGQHTIAPSTVLLTEAAYDETGAECATRMQLREYQPSATWRTTITAVRAPAGDGIVAVDLECFPSGKRRPRTAKPKIVRALLAELRAYDGPSRLTPEALRVTVDQVPALVEMLRAPDRKKPLVVAARPSQSHPLWTERVSGTVHAVAGDASAYLLWDLPAVDAFRAAVGYDHRVNAGAVRVYLPLGAERPAGGGRNHVLGAPRWIDPGDQSWRRMAESILAAAREQPVPQQIAAVEFTDRAAEQHHRERRETLDRARRLADVPIVDPKEQLIELRAEVTLLNELLGQADEELTELGRASALTERAYLSARSELASAAAARDAEVEDHLETLDALARALTEADRLRLLLLRQDRHDEAAEAGASLPGVPGSFEELWQRLGEWEHLLVTADRRTAVGLDVHPEARTWVAKAWTALGALDSYAATSNNGFSGGFYQFCLTPPPGARPYPVRHLAMTESAATMRQYGHERLFPGPDGRRVEMQAHLKLGTRGSVSPRLYFLDEAKSPEGAGAGRLVIGYIGPHLHNTLTN
ncbi:hypothetical protein AB0C52_12745 [Streptomyces sp. NPDC048717]|uniref:hypothetical protein n=1 Tax=Streptomyces sp. NPDC048717 TaxID=3154928 RepID=UPI00343B4BD2